MIPFSLDAKIHGGFLGRAAPAPEIKASLDRSLQLNQVHGAIVHLLKKTNDIESIRGRDGDALVSCEHDIPLVIRTADCVPMLVAHPTGVIAAIHAGWRGVIAGVVSQALQCISSELKQGKLAECRVALGPAICQNCFEIGPEVAEAFQSRIPDAKHLLSRGEKFHLDLKAVILGELIELGIKDSQIETHKVCTRCEEASYYSYRGATQRGEKNDGRNLSWIVNRSA